MLKKHGFAILLFMIAVVMWCLSFPHLPAEVPIHFGADGADGFASKGYAMTLCLVLLIFPYLLVTFLPKFDPNQKNIEKSKKAITMTNYTLLCMMFMINIFVVLSGLGKQIPANFPFLLVGFLFIVIGNYLQQCKHNYFIGVRTPWTLSSENVWNKTHRLASKLFVLSGFLILFASFLPFWYQFSVLLASTLLTVCTLFVYSYQMFKKEQQTEK